MTPWSEATQAAVKEALEFYCNPSDYKAPYTAAFGKLYFDCGAQAKEALELIRQEEEREST